MSHLRAKLRRVRHIEISGRVGKPGAIDQNALPRVHFGRNLGGRRVGEARVEIVQRVPVALRVGGHLERLALHGHCAVAKSAADEIRGSGERQECEGQDKELYVYRVRRIRERGGMHGNQSQETTRACIPFGR